MASNTKVCEFFTSSSGQGCPYGAMCNFSHDLSSGQNNGITPTQLRQAERASGAAEGQQRHRRPCHFYRSGFCKDGSRCKYRHDDPVAPAAPQRRPQSQQAQQNPPRRQGRNICRFFISSGGCRHGENCKFVHEKKKGSGEAVEKREVGKESVEGAQGKEPSDGSNSTRDTTEGSVKGTSGNDLKTESDSHPGNPPAEVNAKPQSKKPRPCRFFSSANGCRLGDSCRFLHEVKAPSEKSDKSKESTPAAGATGGLAAALNTRSNIRPRGPPGGLLECNIDDMSDADQQKALDTEVEMLKKRYPQATEVQREKGGISHQIKFVPTDPDWPYDVKSLILDFHFPPLYPKKMMDVQIPEQENIPETVRRCVLFSTTDWVTARFKNFKKKGRVERVFRPFLRWLDRDLEDIFTDALTHYKRELVAKAAGIEIIPARHLQARYQQEDSDEDTLEEDTLVTDTLAKDTLDEDMVALDIKDREAPENQPPQPDVIESTQQEQSQDELTTQNEEAGEDQNRQLQKHYDPTPKGTEVKLKDLQLGETVATLVATSVKLVIRCSRCKEPAEVATPAERLNHLACGKCNQALLVKYRAAMCHGFSSILGYLDVEECAAFDLLLMDCEFVANCMSCNKDNKVGGIPPGQLKNTWCTTCHSKMSLAIESVQFRQLQPATIDKVDTVHKVQTVKAIRNIRDPAIKEGSPLPDNGICKHYKKSFRWLRFPCCGKTYPCDVCHDQKEDHEMKFANRMVCGYCAREQPFSGLKPCVACGNSMTSKFTEHWEGGKGCRDVIRMSRGDDKKYANSSKTVSRKAQAKASGSSKQSKKTTKLRHT